MKGKVLEDLLERGLRDAILADVKFLLLALDEAEQESNADLVLAGILARCADLVEVTDLLE